MHDESQGMRKRAAAPQHTALTRAVAQACTVLQKTPAACVDDAINTALGLVGDAAGADRAYLFKVVDTVFIRNSHEWCAGGIAPMIDALQAVPYSVGQLFWDRFTAQGSIVIADVGALQAGSELRQILDDQDIRSLIAAPIWCDGQMTGFIGLDYVRTHRQFAQIEDNLLRMLAAAMGLVLGMNAQNRARLRAEDDLAAARARVAAMVQALPEMLVETDRDGTIIGFHQSNPLTFAIRPEEVIGYPPEQVLPGHLAAICRKAMLEVDRLGWSQAHSYPVTMPEGEKWFTLYATRRAARAAGTRDGYLFIVRDITHSTLQHREVRQLVRIAELSTNLIMLADPERRVRWMNPAAVARTGHTSADAVGEHPRDLLRLPDTEPDRYPALCDQLDAGHAISAELRARSRGGTEYWLDLNVQPLRDAGGAVEGYMVVGIDITAHKLAEARALDERRHIMDASREGIAIVQADNRIVYMNPVLRRLLDLTEAAAHETLLWHDVIPDGLAQRMVSVLPELIAQGHWDGAFEMPGPDGAPLHFDMSMTAQDDGSTLVLVRNVTDRKVAEAEQARLREQLQLAQSRQLVSQLAAGLAHDFSNVLAAIAGSVDGLAALSPPEARPALDRIRGATAQAQTLARNLTQLGGDRPAARETDLRAVLDQTADMLRPGLRAQLSLTMALPEVPVPVHGDRIELMQLALNLMLNARDASLDGGAVDAQGVPLPPAVTVRLTPEQRFDRPGAFEVGNVLPDHPYALVEITDTGPGIADALRRKVFAPHYTTRGARGAGLGLAVVADIVLARGGALTLGRAAGGGTRVQLFWPRAPLVAAAPGDDGPPLADTHILLVDDDDSVLQDLSDQLANAGAEVASCTDPADALDAVSADPMAWDMVVTDHDMAALSGPELSRALHAQREGLPVVLMSGNTDLHFATGSVQADFAATLRKPVCKSVLVSVLLAVKLRTRHRI